MKTFKSTYVGQSHQELNIVRLDDGVRVSVDHGSHGATGIVIAQSDAPALALAILEAAGWPEDDPRSATKQIMMWLGDVVRTVERITVEAEAQAKLEAEALELANAAVIECGNPPYPSVERMGEKVLRRWLAVARKAREMAKESTNGR